MSKDDFYCGEPAEEEQVGITDVGFIRIWQMSDNFGQVWIKCKLEGMTCDEVMHRLGYLRKNGIRLKNMTVFIDAPE